MKTLMISTRFILSVSIPKLGENLEAVVRYNYSEDPDDVLPEINAFIYVSETSHTLSDRYKDEIIDQVKDIFTDIKQFSESDYTAEQTIDFTADYVDGEYTVTLDEDNSKKVTTKAQLIQFIKDTLKDQEEAVISLNDSNEFDQEHIAQGWIEACECILAKVVKLK